jgi:hypothetical protein
VPFHRLADEADLEIRLQALVQLLIARGLFTDDELEEEVRQVMRQQEPDGRR